MRLLLCLTKHQCTGLVPLHLKETVGDPLRFHLKLLLMIWWFFGTCFLRQEDNSKTEPLQCAWLNVCDSGQTRIDCLPQCSVCGKNNVRAPSSIRSGSRGSLRRGWGGRARKAAGDLSSAGAPGMAAELEGLLCSSWETDRERETWPWRTTSGGSAASGASPPCPGSPKRPNSDCASSSWMTASARSRWRYVQCLSQYMHQPRLFGNGQLFYVFN